jgi:hypothetical protein
MNPISLFASALRKRAYAVLLGVGLLIFGTVSFRSLLFRAGIEIAYDGRMVTSFCAKSGACIGIYELVIGNTGKLEQERIEAVIHVDPAKWAASHSIADLAGDRARTADPEVKFATSDGAYTYAIAHLVAGAEFKLRLTCAACSIEELRLAKETPVDVRANGTVLHGDPRTTTLGRRLALLFSFF